jgi:hypothetical protein
LWGNFGKEKKGGLDYSFLQNWLLAKEHVTNFPSLLKDKKYKESRERLKRNVKEVGSGWAIEIAALILGKSRALVSQFLQKGALLCSTDGFILPKSVDLNCETLNELESVGSGLKIEGEGDEVTIAKSRCYGIWKKGKIVHCAGHGFQLPKKEFAPYFERMRRENLVKPPTVKRELITTLKRALRDEGKLGETYMKEIHPTLRWDQRRKLKHNVKDIWRDWSWSQPVFEDDPLPPKSKKPSRLSRKGEKEREKAKEWFKNGISKSEIARALRHSRNTIAKWLNE